MTVRFWAGARRAAGVNEQALSARDLAGLRVALARLPSLAPVVEVASLLVEGQATDEHVPLRDGAVVDVLPPFAGGCRCAFRGS